MKIRSSRRQFLQAGAAAVGATLAVKRIHLEAEPLGGAPQQVSASDRVRFGMIGVGMQGSGLLATVHRPARRRVRRRVRPLRRAARPRA